MTAFHDRDRELRAWLPRFGHLRTLALAAHLPALNAQLHEWRNRFAASTCNHRRHALTNLVRVLCGHPGSFDFLDLVRFAPPPPKPRWVNPRHIAAVLAQLDPGSVTRVRLELMHWSGMRPPQMSRLQADDFPARRTDPLRRRPARLGRPACRGPARQGRPACRGFPSCPRASPPPAPSSTTTRWEPWPGSSVNRPLAADARRAGPPAFSTYQIRHSFAAGLRRAGADVADIQDLYGHTPPETTMIHAPPELAKHVDPLERLRRHDATGSVAPIGGPGLPRMFGAHGTG